jgi:hypothetical protein
MFIATNVGVRVLDLTKVNEDETMPAALMKKIIPIKEAYKVTRFQDQLYVLSHNDEANDWSRKEYRGWWSYQKILKKNAWEFWLTDYSMDTWDTLEPEHASYYDYLKYAKAGTGLSYFFPNAPLKN